MESTSRTKAELEFVNFLNKYTDNIKDFTNTPIEKTDLYDDFKDNSFDFTHFDDIYDTLFYSQLIYQTICEDESADALIDLGAGSSVPTLLALKKSKRDLKTLAVDIDPEAIKVSKRNAAQMGLDHLYEFENQSIPAFMDSPLSKGRSKLIVSNPPYIPTPEDINDYYLVPINGGWDGTRYLMDLLDHDHPKGRTIALLWGSLSNPLKLISKIEEEYEVLHLKAMKIHFGHYTKLAPIFSHLSELREKGIVIYEDTSEGEKQIVLGTILRRKDPSKKQ